MKRVAGIILVAALAAATALGEPWRFLPAEWNPWEPLSIDQPMTPVTRWKLRGLKDSPEVCAAVLASLAQERIDYLALDDYTPVSGCPLSNVVRIRRTGLAFNAPFTISCPFAVAWMMFESQRLQPLARRHMEQEIVGIDHFGSFSCRNVYHRKEGRRSAHASAAAFDIAAFRFADGTRVSVLEDWDNAGAPVRELFLREVHKATCGYFGTVLGPDYNAPHANHFHFENRRFGFCR